MANERTQFRQVECFGFEITSQSDRRHELAFRLSDERTKMAPMLADASGFDTLFLLDDGGDFAQVADDRFRADW